MPCIVIDKKNPTKEDIVESWINAFLFKNPELTSEIIQKEIQSTKERIDEEKLYSGEDACYHSIGTSAKCYFNIRCYETYISELEKMLKEV